MSASRPSGPLVIMLTCSIQFVGKSFYQSENSVDHGQIASTEAKAF